ncbi:MAG: hypothetical protein P8Z35_04525 [Ignavibacteriaceae bacterium]
MKKSKEKEVPSHLIKKMQSAGAPVTVTKLNKTPIQSYVKSFFNIVAQMKKDYPQKKFTVDGILVDNIGEILAAEKYLIELKKRETLK